MDKVTLFLQKVGEVSVEIYTFIVAKKSTVFVAGLVLGYIANWIF